MIIIRLLLSVISGCLYRLGGAGKKGDWLDFLRDSKTRDVGVSLVSIVFLLLCKVYVPWWAYVLYFVLCWGALSTYWDWLTKLWRKDEKKYWENWVLHGLFVGLSMAPIVYFTGHWGEYIVRSAVLGVSMMIVSELTGDPVAEEFGRGFLVIFTQLR